MMADRQHVLVVDDEPVLRMILVDLLEGEGYAVEEASNAAEALEVLQALPSIRIVVTDIQMPGSMDGLRLARKTMFFSSAKAIGELGYAPRSVDEALRDAVAWFRQTGMGT